MSALDGKTVSGTKFSGPVGQLIGQENLHTQDNIAFEPVATPVERPQAEVERDLSNDQRILLEYMLGVSSGTVAPSFVNRKPGPLDHARWLTAAIRILDAVHKNCESHRYPKTFGIIHSSCLWESLVLRPANSVFCTLSQKHFQWLKRFQNYLETFSKLLGNIEEVEISK
jgi:hypothetical protein